MSRPLLFCFCFTVITLANSTLLLAAAEPEILDELQLLRREIAQMQSDYETRIAALEKRLNAAEQAQKPVEITPDANRQQTSVEMSVSDWDSPAPQSTAGMRDSSFNPAIGVTFQGQAWAYSNPPEDYMIPGFPMGGEAGLAPEGLALAETEITFSANVDDKFTAMLNLPVVLEDGEAAVEIEEAWVETLSLPAGLSVRMGRVMSNLGYLNTKHFHAWDFADQPLVYRVFLGSQYIDDGLQFRWLAPTEFYLEFSGEALRGDGYPAAGAANSGIGSKTLSARTGGDIGFSNSWQLGVSWLNAKSVDRLSGSEEYPLLFSGDTDLYITDLVWKWSPNGNSRERNFKLQAEYFWNKEDGYYVLADDREEAWDVSQSGWYIQAIFQPLPRWRVGARVDRLGGASPQAGFMDTPLYPQGLNPRRYSLMADWSNSEFSRLRMQYNRDEAGEQDDDQFGLQYIFSIGAHGAHSF